MAQAGKTKEMDMLNGGLAGKLILFSIPLAASSILQQLFNSADVAIATVISNVISAGRVILCLHRKSDEFQFRYEKMHIEKQDFMKVLQIGIPAGIQGAIFSMFMCII